MMKTHLHVSGRPDGQIQSAVVGQEFQHMIQERNRGADAGGPFSYFSTSDRWAELKALMDKRFRDALVRQGVGLVSFLEV
jgi:hypothetical protein